MTQDFDFVVDPGALRSKQSAFIDDLTLTRFLFDRGTVEVHIQSGRPFQLLDPDALLKIDVYPRELIPNELSRSHMVKLFGDREFSVVCYADLMASKLIWADKGSSKSRRDLRVLFSKSSVEDQVQLQAFADEKCLAELLNEILEESDEILE